MRKYLAAFAIAAMAVASAASALPAGAQTPLSCSLTLSTTTLGVGGGTVTVSGIVPGSTPVTILVNGVATNGVPAGPYISDAVTGAFGPITYSITATSTFAIQLPAGYAGVPCAGSPTVVSVQTATATAALPRTGSETRQYVFLGAALLAVGLVLYVGAKRRRDVSSHRA